MKKGDIIQGRTLYKGGHYLRKYGTFSELISNVRKVGKIDSRKMQGQSAFSSMNSVVEYQFWLYRIRIGDQV